MKRNVIEECRSIRRYISKSVSRKEIEQLVEAAALPHQRRTAGHGNTLYIPARKDRLRGQ